MLVSDKGGESSDSCFQSQLKHFQELYRLPASFRNSSFIMGRKKPDPGGKIVKIQLIVIVRVPTSKQLHSDQPKSTHAHSALCSTEALFAAFIAELTPAKAA